MFKSFYIHQHGEPGPLKGRKPRGFTLKVSPHPNPQLCHVQGTWCSSRDAFVKATGRSQADIAEALPFNKRGLPSLVKAMCKETQMENFPHSFDYLYKYML
jgi:hypothetical protein